jgi:hypothetical protein
MRFAKVVFFVAGVWGLLLLIPFYFLFDAIGRQYPPPLTHPDIYYGFLSVTLAWQVAFLTIASNPERFRPMMIAAIVEKLAYVATLVALYAQGRLALGQLLAAGSPDLVLGVLFVLAFLSTRKRPSGAVEMTSGIGGATVAGLVVAGLVAATSVRAEAETRTVVAGARYETAPGGQHWILGRDYRDLWAAPIEVEVLELRQVGGGLTPVTRVGSRQTLGLALKGEDGRDYTFRGVDKGVGRLVPEQFLGTAVEKIAITPFNRLTLIELGVGKSEGRTFVTFGANVRVLGF